jgi:hypothetical protein
MRRKNIDWSGKKMLGGTSEANFMRRSLDELDT